jgi:hypothetical protein
MLAVGSLVSSATGFRVGVSWLGLWAVRTPPLARLAVLAALGGSEGSRAQAAFRDDLLALARESAEASWREMRRGVDELDALTRRDDGEPSGAPPRRPNRVKP